MVESKPPMYCLPYFSMSYAIRKLGKIANLLFFNTMRHPAPPCNEEHIRIEGMCHRHVLHTWFLWEHLQCIFQSQYRSIYNSQASRTWTRYSLRPENQMFNSPFQSRDRLFCDGKRNKAFCWLFLFCWSDRIGFLKLDEPVIVYCLIFTILAQAATITALIIACITFSKYSLLSIFIMFWNRKQR